MRRFRPATDSDLAAVLLLMQDYYREDGYQFDAVESAEAVSALIGDGRLGRLWVACERESVVGYLAVTLGFSLEYRGRDAFIDELYVAESHRGLGLGREALQLAESYCRDNGVMALHLEVEHHRKAARALYSRVGFECHDRVLMTKLLIPDVPE